MSVSKFFSPLRHELSQKSLGTASFIAILRLAEWDPTKELHGLVLVEEIS